MNEDTRVAICCYEGDMHQMYMPAYLHHECPVTVLSPEDSPAIIPGVDCRQGGKRAYIGQDSLDRQRRHLEILLEYPENHFMIHDSDSVCLDPKFPDYLYEQPNVVWSNQVIDAIPEHETQFIEDWPHVAFQPPYFLSRQTIQAMLAVADDPRCKASPISPFIDFYMVQLTMVAGLEWRRFMDCISCPISGDVLKMPSFDQGKREMYERHTALVEESVRIRGANILHSIKDPETVRAFLASRETFLTGNPNPKPRPSFAPIVGVSRARNRRGPMGGPGLKA